jgi:RNA polymerase sigma factor (TIGR02999 family)
VLRAPGHRWRDVVPVTHLCGPHASCSMAGTLISPPAPARGRVPPASDITAVLRAVREGDSAAVDRLFAVVYDELRRVAHGQRIRWQDDATLNTTALVHETYLKLVGNSSQDWRDRAHFFAVAAQAMRHILVNYAERRVAAKRGGGAVHISLDEANPVPIEAAEELLALDEALQALARENARQAQVVECRFFGGLGIRETADALGISSATVERDWAAASAWLRRTLEGQPGH